MKEIRLGIEKIKAWVVISVDPIPFFSIGIFRAGFTILKECKIKLRWHNEN